MTANMTATFSVNREQLLKDASGTIAGLKAKLVVTGSPDAFQGDDDDPIRQVLAGSVWSLVQADKPDGLVFERQTLDHHVGDGDDTCKLDWKAEFGGLTIHLKMGPEPMSKFPPALIAEDPKVLLFKLVIPSIDQILASKREPGQTGLDEHIAAKPIEPDSAGPNGNRVLDIIQIPSQNPVDTPRAFFSTRTNPGKPAEPPTTNAGKKLKKLAGKLAKGKSEAEEELEDAWNENAVQDS